MAPSGSNFIGIDLSGPLIHAALVSAEGQKIESREAEIRHEHLIEQVAELGRELGSGKVSAMGIAIPGLVNRQTDRVVVSRDLPTTVREDLHSEFTRATGLRVEIENDAN